MQSTATPDMGRDFIAAMWQDSMDIATAIATLVRSRTREKVVTLKAIQFAGEMLDGMLLHDEMTIQVDPVKPDLSGQQTTRLRS